jgi:hypothetical protein
MMVIPSEWFSSVEVGSRSVPLTFGSIDERWDDVRWDDVRWDDVRWDDVCWDEERWDDAATDRFLIP